MQTERLPAFFSVSELAELSGVDSRRLIPFLQNRGIIEKGKRGEKYCVMLEDLAERVPAFWRTVVRRIEAKNEAKV